MQGLVIVGGRWHALRVWLRADRRGARRPVLRGPEPGQGPGGTGARRAPRSPGTRPRPAQGLDLLGAADRPRPADLAPVPARIGGGPPRQLRPEPPSPPLPVAC